MFSITADGMERYLLLKEQREQEAQRRAEEILRILAKEA